MPEAPHRRDPVKPDPAAWQALLPAYEAEQWDECVRIVRRWVDDDPYDMTSRALLASLHARAGSTDLARLQYEKLLPMAVGQGDVLRAICTQKRLDAIHADAEGHAERFRAMHEWFRYLAPDAGRNRRKGRRDSLASALIGLPDDVFAGGAERATMQDLAMTRRRIPVGDGILWAVHYGRVRWHGVGADGAAIEGVAAAGEPISVRSGDLAGPCELTPLVPTDCIAFEPALASALGLAMSTTPDDRPGLNQVVAGAPDEEAGASAIDVGGGTGEGTGEQIVREDALEPTVLPTPDPLLEPMFAVGASHERRRETRVAVALENKVAFLGEIGKRVSPLHGKLVDLSPGGLGVAFPAAQLRQAEGVFPGAVLPVKLSLRGSSEPIEVAARVVWIRKAGAPAGEALMGLQFVGITAEDRSRLIHILDEAARSGIEF